MELSDTIAAIASGNQPAPRGTIRVSGPAAMKIVERCLVHADSSLARVKGLKKATAIPAQFLLPSPFPPIECTAYCWPNRKSYTQQPSAEFHLIGSIPILNAALRKICDSGARLAEPGEFTMRAFLAGRLDLTQAEAVLGVIDARDQQELNVALAQLSGGLAEPLSRLRDELIELLAHLEAGLDFVEEDIEFISARELCNSLATVESQIHELQSRMTTRDLKNQLPAVVLFGWPNAGKSSLFNRLCGDDHAIVNQQSGTTRDFLEQEIEIDGSRFRLVDTAGFDFESSDETIASAAQHMTSTRYAQADLKLFCIDSTREPNEWETEQLSQCDDSTIIVLTKCESSRVQAFDDRSEADATNPAIFRLGNDKAICTSSQTGFGVETLQKTINSKLVSLLRTSDLVVAETARRSSDSLQQASAAIQRAIAIGEANAGEELVAAELRDALDQLGRIVGAIYTDDILDQVFSRFCIGK